MKTIKIPYTMLVVSLILGFLLTVQIRVSREMVNAPPLERSFELTSRLKSLTEEIEGLMEEKNSLSQKINMLEKGGKIAEDALISEINKNRFWAGATPAYGPGVRVILNNPPGFGNNSELFNVRDEDLFNLLNELKAAGAEGIAVNGQRVTALTEVRMAGNKIVVNTKAIYPPYEILAVGNPEQLKTSLENGIVATFREWQMEVTITKENKLVLPPYEQNLEFSYIKPQEAK
ncbi:DUF881 domain-containing protein [Carboxydothermus hydrogenoformans]|uniref:Division initiation protein n=1 Tax=Carboxydothermus hydrogenoformans (strain ATCC BAA-161 / DSM 6008 / Z-2901) TaxID=246194 RepID=Q3AAF2_CARHZ|nr:DUF881 domain-containing protein [Carboxydothermus hydrogenoformans]ABB15432.1 conserved hypothetical protein [Carboxydothermus hydrogenoformans Z-2901]